MTTAATLAKMPTWPRRMQEDMAAAYCGVSLSKFRAGVSNGRYPAGLKDGGNVLWYIEDVDRALDNLKAGGGTLPTTLNEDAETHAWIQDLEDDQD